MTKQYHIALVSLITAMLIWASSFIALKLSFEELHPAQVLFIRMSLASFCFLLIWKWIPRTPYKPGDWKLLLLMVTMEPCLYFVFEAIALQNTSASQAGVVTSLLPLLTAIGAYLAFNERLNRLTILGFVIAIGGGILLSLSGEANEHAPNPILGNFFELLAMVCAAVYTLTVKFLVARYSALYLTAIQVFSGSLFFLIPALYVPFPSSVSATTISAVVYLGVCVSIGAYGMYNYALTKVPATQAASFINLIPAFTVLFAFVLLGERLNAWQVIACIIVISGLAISQLKPSTQSRQQHP